MRNKRNREHSNEENNNEKRFKNEQEVIDFLEQTEYEEWEEQKEDNPRKRKNIDDSIESLPNKKSAILYKELFYKIRENFNQKIDCLPDFLIRRAMQDILARIENIRDGNVPQNLLEQRDKWQNPSDEIKNNLEVATKETFDEFYNYFKDNHQIDSQALGSDSDFSKYLSSFFAINKERSAKLLYNFCGYLCELTTKEKPEIEVLLLSYPPNNSAELLCLDGNFERIEYLYRKLRILDEEEVLLNSHNQVMLKFANELEPFVINGNQIHITPLLEKAIGVRKESAIHALSQIPSEIIFSLFSKYPKLFREELKTELSKLHNSFDSIKDALDNFVEKDENGQFNIDEFSFYHKNLESVYNIINQLSGTLVSEGNFLFEDATNYDEILNFDDETKETYIAKYDNAISSFNDKLKPSLEFIENEIQKYGAQIDITSNSVSQLRQLEGIYQSEDFLPIISELINNPKTPYEFLSGCEALWSVSESFYGSSSYYLAKVLIDSDVNIRAEKIEKFRKNLQTINEILPNQSDKFKDLYSKFVTNNSRRYSGNNLEYNDKTLDDIAKGLKLNHLVVSAGYPNQIIIDAIKDRAEQQKLREFLDSTDVGNINYELNGNNLGKVLSSRSGFEKILLELCEKIVDSRDNELVKNFLFIVEKTFKYSGVTNKTEKIPLLTEALLQKGFHENDLEYIFYHSYVLDNLASFNEHDKFKKLLSYFSKNKIENLTLEEEDYPNQNLLQNPLYIIAKNGNFKFLTELHDCGHLGYNYMLKYSPALLHIAALKKDFSFIRKTLLAENNSIPLGRLFEFIDNRKQNVIDCLGENVSELFDSLPKEYFNNYGAGVYIKMLKEACTRNNFHLVSYFLKTQGKTYIIGNGLVNESLFAQAFVNKAELSLIELLNHRILVNDELSALFSFMFQAKDKSLLERIFTHSIKNDKPNACYNLLKANVFHGLQLQKHQEYNLRLENVGFFMLSESLCLNEEYVDLIFRPLLKDSNSKNLIEAIPKCMEQVIQYKNNRNENTKINPNSLCKYGGELASKSSKFSKFLIEYSVKNQINDIGVSPSTLLEFSIEKSSKMQDYNQIDENNEDYKLLANFVDLFGDKSSLQGLVDSILEGKVKDCVLIDIAVKKNILEINPANIERLIKNSNLSTKEDCLSFIEDFKYLTNSFISKNHSSEEKIQFSEAIILAIDNITNAEGKQLLAEVFSQSQCCLDDKFNTRSISQDFRDNSGQNSPLIREGEVNHDRVSTPSPTQSFELSDYEEEEESKNDIPDKSVSSPSVKKNFSNDNVRK